MNLNGKTAIVTGAAGGIGGAIVRELHEQGAKVALADLKDGMTASLVEELNNERPGSALEVATDISDQGSAEAAVQTVVDELGGVDVLVNNAGIDKIEKFVDS